MANLGQHIDSMYALAQKIKAAESVVKDLKRKFSTMESAMLREFEKETIDGALGKRGRASLKKARFPTIKDRSKFGRWVLKNKALDLFQNRISSKAYFDRLDEGEAVPGVEVFERISVSITKRKVR